MNINFENKTIMITGAAGFLGQELAKMYFQSKAEKMILVDHMKKMDKLKELKESYSNAFIYCCDFCNHDEIIELSTKIKEDGHKIDVLVNNVGINILLPSEKMDYISWNKVVETNLTGNYFITKLIASDSLINARGNVVFISSQHGVVGNVNRTAYCSSKAALIGLVHALVAEWGKYGVRVNAISPTYIENSENKDYLYSNSNVRKMLQKIPLGSYATYNDVASAIIFITSDKAGMINGHNLVIDGGYVVL